MTEGRFVTLISLEGGGAYSYSIMLKECKI